MSVVLSDSMTLPSMIGRFRIVEELGRGAMGVVYRAIDPLIERTVAIKTIPLDLPEAERAQFEERFLREAKSAGRLSHPNIVTIYDVGEAGDVAYIAMEYLRGQSLKDILDLHGPLPLDLALDTAIQMADALAFAHEHGVVHRDVKPGNVIVLKNRGVIKLTDFGIAHINAAQSETRAGVLLGSPRYMAPEQITGKPVDGRTDVFSTGVVLYEMLTGLAPFTAPDLHMLLYRIVNETPLPASRLRPDIHADVDRLLTRCMAKQPNLRPAGARELSQELKKIAAPGPVKPPAVTSPKKLRRLALFAFSIPVLVFLMLFLGLVIINYFVTHQAAVPTAPTTMPDGLATHEKPAGRAKKSSLATSGSEETHTHAAQATRAKPTDPYLEKLDKKLAELRVKRAELLSTYTELHPDVVILDRQIEQFENERADYLEGK